jgi:hypothetical protein
MVGMHPVSQQAIVAYLNTALPQAGWVPVTPQNSDQIKCGLFSHDFWLWIKGDSAVGYSFPDQARPQWQLGFCSLIFGR